MLTSTTNSATGPQLIPFRFGRFCRMEWAFMQLASESSDDELDGDGGAEKTTSRVVPPRVGMRGWALLACFYFVGVTGSKRPESILAGRLAASAFGWRGWQPRPPARESSACPAHPPFQKQMALLFLSLSKYTQTHSSGTAIGGAHGDAGSSAAPAHKQRGVRARGARTQLMGGTLKTYSCASTSLSRTRW